MLPIKANNQANTNRLPLEKDKEKIPNRVSTKTEETSTKIQDRITTTQDQLPIYNENGKRIYGEPICSERMRRAAGIRYLIERDGKQLPRFIYNGKLDDVQDHLVEVYKGDRLIKTYESDDDDDFQDRIVPYEVIRM